MNALAIFLTVAAACGVISQSYAQSANDNLKSRNGMDMRIIPLEAKLPTPPPGYEWKSCIKNQVEILVPSSWEIQSRQGRNVVQCAAAENVDVAPTEFSGLEVALYIKPGIPGIQTPSEYVAGTMSILRSKAQSYEESQTNDQRFSYRTARVALNNDRAIMAYAEDRSTGATVQLILTSPSQRWPEIESKGRIAVLNVAVARSI
jgi:hypothetical protein